MERLLSTRETAPLLGISKSNLYCLAQRGVVPHVKIGGRILYRESALEEWLQEHTEGGEK